MMDFLLFMGFSVLESSAGLYLIFRLFKINLMVPEILLAGILMAFVSFELRTHYHLPQVDVFVQVLLMFCFMWLLFRIHIYYAAVLSGILYQTYYLIQNIFYLIMYDLGLFGDNLPYPLSISTYVLQTASATAAFLTGWYIYDKRKGFDFVPDKPRGRLNLKRRDKILMIITLPSMAIVMITLNFGGKDSMFFYVAPIIFALNVYVYMHISYRKDREE